MQDFQNPTQDEIIQILRDHPLVKLRERVLNVFLVGSFAKEQLGIGQTHAESDVDILLEIVPKKDWSQNDLEEKYRQALRQYFVHHNIRGKLDSVHPQWAGRRVDVYLTYDVSKEGRPKIELAKFPMQEKPSPERQR